LAGPVVSRYPSQFADTLHQDIRDGEIRSYRGKQLVFGDKAARIFDKVLQERESLRPRGNLGPVEKETVAPTILDIAIES
jgi:hypothetical protein